MSAPEIPFKVRESAKPATEEQRLRERIFYRQMELKTAEGLAKAYAAQVREIRGRIKADERALAKLTGEA